MKRIFGLILLTFLSCLMSIQAQSVNLPEECVKILNENFKGWKLAKVDMAISDYHQEMKSPDYPNFIKGDWNGDRKNDYAILVEYGKTQVNNGSSEAGTITIAFVKKAKGYAFYRLEGGDYIQIFKKGEKDYDYGSQKDFVYKNDAIFVGLGECCGSSYLWRKGKFISIVTSD